MSLELRDYQKKAVESFFSFVKNGGRSGIISAPTGSGEEPNLVRHLQTDDDKLALYQNNRCYSSL